MERLKRWFNDLESNVGFLVLLSILAVLFLQVVLRYVFRSSNTWSEEVARYLLIWFAYISASLCVLTNSHIRIDSLLNVWPKALRPVIVIIGNLVFLAFSLFSIYHGYLFTRTLMETGQISLGLRLEMWIVYLCIPVCNTLISIRLVQVIIRTIKENFGAAKKTVG